MHELYIAECVLKSAKKSLPADTVPEAIELVCIRVGKLDAVIPESLKFLFDAIKPAHNMPHAALEIEEEAVKCRCKSCQVEFALNEPVFVCPECGHRDLTIIAGRGITLQQITIKED